MSDRIEHFDYRLPEDRIAQYPSEQRGDDKLLVLNKDTGEIRHRHFSDLIDLLRSGDVLVLNDSRVIPARIRGRKPTGGHVEIFLLKKVERHSWVCMLRLPGHRKEGTIILLTGDHSARVVERVGSDTWLVEFHGLAPDESVPDCLGDIPLPPYISRSTDQRDSERYQTIYARHDGSVAAPTAGLHFTPETIAILQQNGVQIAYLSLHVGPGTFQPVRSKSIRDHHLDPEWFSVPESTAEQLNKARSDNQRIVAVGTTVTRTLEYLVKRSDTIIPGEGFTDLLIYPPYKFRIVNALITNFHLPRSSLLALVAAFGGLENVMNAYAEAIESSYRFYSYGDAMFIE